MDPEALAALQLVRDPIGVVSVCGRARQGKSFILNQDYRRTAFLEADLRCSENLQSIEKKLQAACQLRGVKIDYVIQVLDSSLSEYYESSAYGPGKWKMLAVLLLQCLEGPVLDLSKKQLDQAESERGVLLLICWSNEDKLALLKKQLDENEKHKAEYLKRYEEVINEKQKVSQNYSSRIANLQGKCSYTGGTLL